MSQDTISGSGLPAHAHERVPAHFVRSVLKENCFGVEDWKEFYGVEFGEAELDKVKDFPWGNAVLDEPCSYVRGKRVRETHFAFLGLSHFKGRPLTIMEWHRIHHHLARPCFALDPNPWYRKSSFATMETCDFRWYLVLRDPPSWAVKVGFPAVLQQMPDDYTLSPPIIEVTKHLLFYKKNGRYPNDQFGRCFLPSFNLEHKTIPVGAPNEEGVLIQEEGQLSARYTEALSICVSRSPPQDALRGQLSFQEPDSSPHATPSWIGRLFRRRE